jgi:hypothetical protein
MKAPRPEGRLLTVRVEPRAPRSEVAGWRGSALRVRVTAPPADGEANRAVAALLARTFGVALSSVELVKGARSRDKVFRVSQLSVDDLRARLPEARA